MSASSSVVSTTDETGSTYPCITGANLTNEFATCAREVHTPLRALQSHACLDVIHIHGAQSIMYILIIQVFILTDSLLYWYHYRKEAMYLIRLLVVLLLAVVASAKKNPYGKQKDGRLCKTGFGSTCLYLLYHMLWW